MSFNPDDDDSMDEEEHPPNYYAHSEISGILGQVLAAGRFPEISKIVFKTKFNNHIKAAEEASTDDDHWQETHVEIEFYPPQR